MKAIYWRKSATFTDKRRAKRQAKMLRAPGEHRVRARIVKETYWRVDYGVPVEP